MCIGVSGEHWGVRWGQMSIGRVSGGVSEHWRGCQVGSGEHWRGCQVGSGEHWRGCQVGSGEQVL